MFQKRIYDVLKVALPERASFDVAPPEISEHGDYASNIALASAKTLGKNPRELAEEIKKSVMASSEAGSFIEKIDVAGPGFLNITLKDQCLCDDIQKVLNAPSDWGKIEKGNNAPAIVEYFQLNIAKTPHVGHLRSAIIGDALKRLLINADYHAISDTHVGDWGTQFGIVLYAYKKAKSEDPHGIAERVEQDPFGLLEELYKKGNEDIEKDPTIRDVAKKEFADLEKGDEKNRELWSWMVELSMKKLTYSAERLNLLPFDEHMGESAYEAMMPGIITQALDKNVVTKKDDGAVVVDLTHEGLDEAVLVKSDGATTYLLRDLATVEYRARKYNFAKNLYVVDVRQEHHFKQVLRVAELIGIAGVSSSEHISYGFMKLPDGMLSTRKGNVISLDAVLDEAEQRARAIIEEKNPGLADKDRVAKQVALAAIKYFDLSHNRHSDIVFQWNEALSFEGDTGPYIQYTYARLMSVLKKAGGSTISAAIPPSVSMDKEERSLMMSVLRFPEAVGEATKFLMPHYVARFVYELAQALNTFYQTHPVAQEPDENKRALRVALVTASAITIKNALQLLGIEAPESM
jgi:arginyl-tRNA synthetase